MTVSITDNTISQDGAAAVKFNAGGVSSSAKQITASVAANALTVGLNPCVLDFRSATLTDGTTNTRLVDAALSLTVPDTATLGTVNAVQSRLILLAIDNAGTVELAIVNQSGGNNLDETTLISTTAIDATADSANVIYSTTARSNVPFRVVGYIESTQATAGTWATSPSTLQGAGGNALIKEAVNLQICKAWVNFNGTGTVAIRDSYNVSSITDNGTGNYTVNFTNAMSDTNYFYTTMTRANARTGGYVSSATILTTSVAVVYYNSAGTATDYDAVGVAVFGN